MILRTQLSKIYGRLLKMSENYNCWKTLELLQSSKLLINRLNVTRNLIDVEVSFITEVETVTSGQP